MNVFIKSLQVWQEALETCGEIVGTVAGFPRVGLAERGLALTRAAFKVLPDAGPRHEHGLSIYTHRLNLPGFDLLGRPRPFGRVLPHPLRG